MASGCLQSIHCALSIPATGPLHNLCPLSRKFLLSLFSFPYLPSTHSSDFRSLCYRILFYGLASSTSPSYLSPISQHLLASILLAYNYMFTCAVAVCFPIRLSGLVKQECIFLAHHLTQALALSGTYKHMKILLNEFTTMQRGWLYPCSPCAPVYL